MDDVWSLIGSEAISIQLVEDGNHSADLFFLTYVIRTEKAKLCYAVEVTEFCTDQIRVLSERKMPGSQEEPVLGDR